MSLKNLPFIVAFMLIGALGYGWWINHSAIVARQEAKIEAFVSAGPRFTAKDGQALCERVRALEERSYGFRDAGKMPLACDYFHDSGKE